MKLLRYEFKKLLGVKYVFIVIAIALVLNGALLISETRNVSTYDTELLIKGYEDYLSDPNAFEAYLTEIDEFSEEQDRLSLEAMLNGDDYERIKKEWRYTGLGTGNIEKAFLKVILDAAEDAVSYKSDIRLFITQNKAKLRQYDAQGVSNDSFLYRYTEYIIGIYEEHLERDIGIGFEYVHGWDTYFFYDEGNLLVLLVILITVCNIMLSDKSSGFYVILSATKKGRRHSLGAKLWLSTLMSMAVSLIFSLTSLVLCGARIGFSSPFNVIQAISDFRYAPFDMSVLEYLFIFIFVKMVVHTVFAMIVAAFSTVLNNYVYSYLAGAGFVGVNLFLHVYDHLNAEGFFAVNNMVSLLSTNHLSTRVRAFSFFGAVADNRICLPILLLIFVCAAVVAVFALYHRRGMASGKVTELLRKIIPKRIKRRKKSDTRYSTSLFGYELYKTAGSFFAIFAILICTFCSIQASQKRYDTNIGYFEVTYNAYMDDLSGVADSQSDEYISLERSRLQEIISKKSQMQNAYAAGQINRDEYSEYLELYYSAESQLDVLDYISERQRYFGLYSARFNENLWYLHDLEYQRYFSVDFNIWLYLVILVLSAGNFVAEFKSNSKGGRFYAIMSCTKRGRKQTFWAKQACTVSLATVLFVLYTGAEIYFLGKASGFPELSAPLASLPNFEYLPWRITIGQYIILNIVMQYVGVILFVIIINSVSALTKKLIPTLTVTTLITILPHGCVMMGAKVMKFIDFTSLLDTHSLLQYSSSTIGDFLYGTGIYWGTIVFWSTVSVILMVQSYTAFTKKIYRKDVYR